MSELNKLAKNIIEPIDYVMSKLPTFKNLAEGTTIKISGANDSSKIESIKAPLLQDSNQLAGTKTITVSG